MAVDASAAIHPDMSPVDVAANRSRIQWYDAEVRDIEGEEYSAYGVTRESGGVIVVGVSAAWPAAASGLRRGDLVRAVNGKSVANIGELSRILDGLTEATPLRINVIHADQSGAILVVTAGVQSPKI